MVSLFQARTIPLQQAILARYWSNIARIIGPILVANIGPISPCGRFAYIALILAPNRQNVHNPHGDIGPIFATNIGPILDRYSRTI